MTLLHSCDGCGFPNEIGRKTQDYIRNCESSTGITTQIRPRCTTLTLFRGKLEGVVTLRLFAQAREAAGVSQVELDASTVDEALNLAVDQFGNNFDAILRTSKIWLNGSPVDSSDELKAGDELAVLPPVSGG